MRRKETKWIVLHTSATKPTMDIGAAEIGQWHRQAGWSGIGYHYVIRRDGRVETGRNERDVGSHVRSFNSKSLGICMVGGLAANGKAHDNYTREQWASLKALVNQIVRRYPQAVILGHRDFSPDRDRDGVVEPHEWIKDCPCFNARKWALDSGFPAAPLKPLALAGMMQQADLDRDREPYVAERPLLADKDKKPVLQHRRVWAGIAAWFGGGGGGILGMLYGWDWMAILIICAFVTLWVGFFWFMYRKEIAAGLFSPRKER